MAVVECDAYIAFWGTEDDRFVESSRCRHARARALWRSLQPSAAQTRERGPWWPSVHGPEDQAGASNYVTAAKILAALTIPKTGQTYELGHPYETSMPQYGSRPYFLNVLTRAGHARARRSDRSHGVLHGLHRADGHAVRCARSSGALRPNGRRLGRGRLLQRLHGYGADGAHERARRRRRTRRRADEALHHARRVDRHRGLQAGADATASL